MTNIIIIIILIIILCALFGTEPHPAAAMWLPATFCTLLGNERRYPAGMFAVSTFVACFCENSHRHGLVCCKTDSSRDFNGSTLDVVSCNIMTQFRLVRFCQAGCTEVIHVRSEALFLVTLDIIFAETMIKQKMQEEITETLYKVILQTEQDTFWCISNPITTTS